MAMLRPATEIKDSGIEWIGSIPQKWGIIKNKYLLHGMYSGGTPKATDDTFYVEDGIPFVSISDMSTTDYVYETKKHLSEAGLKDKNLKVLDEGTILYSIYATIGAVSELRIKATISQAMLALSLQDGYHKDYYKYNLQAMRDSVFALSNGNTQFNLNAEKVWNFTFVNPPLSEQKAIADYLDERCSKIDEIIAEATASIEDYKELRKVVITEAVTTGMCVQGALKNSGYDWMGYIPSDWNIAPLKHISTKPISYGVIKLFDPDENGVFILRCSDVKAGFLDTTNIRTITKELSNEYKRTLLSENDVVINVRGTLGGCAVIPKSMEGYNIAREVALISPDRKKYDSKYIMYYLLSDVFERFRDSFLSGAIYVGINMETLSHFRIAYPSIDEQREIAKYLDKKVSDIDALISEKQALIDDLQAYKKSLIYEVVTGKRRVV